MPRPAGGAARQRAFTLLALLSISLAPLACSNEGNSASVQGGAGTSNSGGSGGAKAGGSCLEKPSELARPPQKGLPCDLFPPTVTPR